MYSTVRQYIGINDQAFAALLSRRADVEAVIQQTPGFAQYDLIRTAGGMTSVTVCAEQAGAEDSNRRVAAWLQANMPDLAPTPPQIATGESVIHMTANGSATTWTPMTHADMEAALRPYARARDEGEAYWFLGAQTWVKATSAQTGGTLGLVEQVLPAGFASPWHRHHAEDEAFYVVEGEMSFLCGDERTNAGPGTWVWGPRGIPHGFRVEGTEPARFLLFATPGGFEQFVVELGEPAADWSSPPSGPPDMEKVMATAARYRVDILGPLPD